MRTLERSRTILHSAERLKADILERLHEESVIGLDALVETLPDYSWNQVFHAVDELARTGGIVLRRHGYDYTLFSTAYPA
ncbi:MAG TPA: hypothetical protein VJL88_08095 [Nitrospira sp.]|nr:hypothetical protein [Nitrospira sp.]